MKWLLGKTHTCAHTPRGKYADLWNAFFISHCANYFTFSFIFQSNLCSLYYQGSKCPEINIKIRILFFFFLRISCLGLYSFTATLKWRHFGFPHPLTVCVHGPLHCQYHSPEWPACYAGEPTLTRQNRSKSSVPLEPLVVFTIL